VSGGRLRPPQRFGAKGIRAPAVETEKPARGSDVFYEEEMLDDRVPDNARDARPAPGEAEGKRVPAIGEGPRMPQDASRPGSGRR
jgi:hypothetical protein